METYIKWLILVLLTSFTLWLTIVDFVAGNIFGGSVAAVVTFSNALLLAHLNLR